jgi:hypothetical protein
MKQPTSEWLVLKFPVTAKVKPLDQVPPECELRSNPYGGPK